MRRALTDLLGLLVGGLLLLPAARWAEVPAEWVGAALLAVFALRRWAGEAESGRQARALGGALEACREATVELQAREDFHRTILEDIPEMICRWRPDGRISYVNEAYCSYFGLAREQVLAGAWMPLVDEGGGLLGRGDQSLYRRQPVAVIEFPVTQPDGTVRWQRWVDRALFDEAGNISEFQSIGEDITQRKQADEEARRLLAENRKLARLALAAQEEERKRLARELHDELGQALTAIRADAETIRRLNAAANPGIGECAGAISGVAGDVYEVVRRMMQRLHPAVLDDLGLAEALGELARQWREHLPTVRIDADLDDPEPLTETTRLAAYRIAQEALTNIAKHAGASCARLALRPLGVRWFELRVEDDGCGLSEAAGGEGFGLLGMRERALTVGGRFELRGHPDGGVRIRVLLPRAARGAHPERAPD